MVEVALLGVAVYQELILGDIERNSNKMIQDIQLDFRIQNI